MRIFAFFAFAVVAHGQVYFPTGAFSSRVDVDQRAASIYSSILKSFDEKPLYSLTPPDGVECYRLIWLRSFSRPVVLELTVLKDGDGTLAIKVGSDDDPVHRSYKGLRLIRDEKRNLSQKITGNFRGYVDLSDLYKIPRFDEERGLDGSTWIIEAVSYGKYHIVSRWSPKSGSVREVGTRMIYLAIGGDLVPIY